MSIVSLPRMAAGVACVLMLAASPAFAQDKDDSSSDHGHKRGPGQGHGPSPEARKALADACSDKSEGNDCAVELDEHTLNGKCAKSERSDTLFCRPEMHRPMRAAFAACKDKKENDDCSFERREGDGNIDGHCEEAPPPRMHREGGDDGHANNGDHPRWGDHDQNQGGEQRERPLICMPERDGD